MYSVYIKTDEAGRVIEINSDAFLNTLEGWQKVGNGSGDRYHHAQNHYLDKPLTDERGLFNYKYADGAIVERSEDEKTAEYVPPIIQPSTDERIKQLEEALTALLEGAQE